MPLFTKHFSGGALLLILIVGVAILTGQRSATASSQTEEIKVHDTGLTIDWQTPETLLSTPINQLDFQNSSLDQYSIETRPGYPQLPYQVVTFTIPDSAELEFTVELSKQVTYRFTPDVTIAPQPSGFRTNDAGEIVGGAFAPAAALSNVSLPHVTVEEIGRFSGYRLARAVFYPIAQEGGKTTAVMGATATIQFEGYVPSRAAKAVQPVAASSLTAVVVNPEHAAKAQFGSRQSGTAPESAAAVVYVQQSGMVELTYEDWVASGLTASDLNPQKLQISHAGTPVHYQWVGNANATFESGEAVIFFAPEFSSRWSEAIPFLFSNSGGGQAVMGTRSGSNAGGVASADAGVHIVIEENTLYSSDCMCGNLPTGWDGDRWFWQELSRPGNEQATLSFEADRVSLADTAEMTLWLVGYTALTATPDHKLQIKLNGSTIGTTTWDGKTLHTPSFTLPAGLLKASNQLELTMVDNGSAIDGIWLDAIELTYKRDSSTSTTQEVLTGAVGSQSYSLPISSSTSLAIYDVSDTAAPVRLTAPTRQSNVTYWSDEAGSGTTYAIVPANDFLSPSQIIKSSGLTGQAASGGSYIMIAPAEFVNSGALEPLINLRTSLGWSVVVESTEEISAAFDGGVKNSPDAIKRYMEWAYNSWQVQPEMLLLVGDGTNDPKQHRETTSIVRVPSYLAEVDPWIGETAADNRYVAVDGNDPIPDLSLGRLPVNSVEELAGVVNKIIQYETGESFGDWNFQMTIVTDDNDQAGNFDQLSDRLVDEYLTAPWLPTRVYLGSNNLSASTAQNQILSRWRGGQGMIMFTGHSSIHQWAAERLFHIDEIAALRNSNRLPVMMQMSCFTGSYHSSVFNTLDEQLVRQADGGAIAAWGATGLGVATGHDEMAAAALNSLYRQNNPTLGVATLAGKVRLASEKPAFNDLLDTFNLLGDPALQVKLAENSGSPPPIFLPIILTD